MMMRTNTKTKRRRPGVPGVMTVAMMTMHRMNHLRRSSREMAKARIKARARDGRARTAKERVKMAKDSKERAKTKAKKARARKDSSSLMFSRSFLLGCIVPRIMTLVIERCRLRGGFKP